MSEPSLNNICEITIPGPPIGKERPRLSKRRVYTPQKTRLFEHSCGFRALAAMATNPVFRQGIKEPMQIYIDFSIYHDRKYKSCPDADNVVKAVLDGLEGIIYENDRQVLPRVQVVEYECKQPRVELRIEVI